MSIQIKGAGEHNLRDIDVEVGDGLTVVTGVSGSGKTSLVFDTLYHEARRRFLAVSSPGSTALRLSPAQVQSISGLGPAIAVGQNLLNRNPNSTLATACGLHPFLRLLYARFGERFCPGCASGLSILAEDEIVERLLAMSRRDALVVLAPLMRGVRGSHRTLLELLSNELGPDGLLVDGHPWRPHQLDPTAPHDIEIEVARWTGQTSAAQAREAVQMTAALGAHAITARSDSQESTFSRAPACVTCGTWFGDLEPVHFHTRCPHCKGPVPKAEGCERCDGTGLHPEAAAVRWRDLRLPDLLAGSVDDARALFADKLPSSGARLQSEIERRLETLNRVGLGYVDLDRPSPTLSRGEAQRVRLAVALTSRLEDMLHILDEPSIGQHPADVARLLPAFRELAGPVIFVEHDRAAAAVADQDIDLGPGAGDAGGRLLFSSSPAALWETDTPTGRFFSQRERVLSPEPRPKPEHFLTLRGANLRNLRQIDVPIPLGRLSVVTGVSGSGKSTLVEEVLVASLSAQKPVGCRAVEGPALRAMLVDQAPIGRNPRSNPATYTKLADVIRDCFAAVTGLSASHFSFNRREGACPACQGMGATEVRMRSLPSTWIPCAACGGQRFSDQVLSARIDLRERTISIADLYRLSVADATPLLTEERLPKSSRQAARPILQALSDVGLGYLPLGQPSPTLSGGEAQRVKLAKYLGRKSLSRSLLVLDEPSTGLHPQDLAGLLVILDRLVRAGATVVIVEHNTDVIGATDWIIDLGPGAGPAGGQVLWAGPPDGLTGVEESITGQALRQEATIRPEKVTPDRPPRPATISIRDARAHNLQGVDVDFPCRALTVVTGVSGSGKSSLVGDVLEAEARRRFLESLSVYERQSTREGPEAPVGSVTGLGVAIAVGTQRGRFELRTSVGTTTEISHHLAVSMACLGQRPCPQCSAMMQRTGIFARDEAWLCASCHQTAPVASPRHFLSSTYAAACLKCHGVGTLQIPNPDKLIVHPDKPLCGGAMYSPGFFPQGYLGKPFNGGYDMVRALAARYGFDPATTAWNEMTPQAQQAFLFGDPEPIEVIFQSRTQTTTRTITFPGFFGWIRDWDVGGTYTDAEACPDCNGTRLRPEYLSVTLQGQNVHDLSELPLHELARVLGQVCLAESDTHIAAANLHTIRRRLGFLLQVGLGYLHLNRVSATLSAGEAQRIKLAGLLGSGLTSLTILLDEPSRGLHPCEVDALLAALRELIRERNTVIVVEHDPVFIGAADHLVDMGPGAGIAGGRIVAQGKPAEVARTDTLTARWLRGEQSTSLHRSRREPRAWLTIGGARANNLWGENVRLPLGVLAGVCGVSGSGKSTLVIDTLGRALAPRRQTTSVAYEPVEPGEHEAIEGAPTRVIVVDQATAGVRSPANFLGLNKPLHRLFAASEDARGLGLDEAHLGRSCSVCKGSGSIGMDMGFLPDVHTTCDTCRGTGYRPEAWEVRLRGLALPEVLTRTVDEVHDRFGDQEGLARSLKSARDVGLGYLVLRQPGHALSGGEAQRLKIAKELARGNRRCRASETLYILDEPTVGQHLEDVARLIAVLQRLVDDGHTVLIVEHHPHLLAACDWLVELGPGGGPDGGRIVAANTPEALASGNTATAAYLRQVLGGQV